MLLWPERSLSVSITEKGIGHRTGPCPPGRPLGLLLAWILGWQCRESDPQETVPSSSSGAGHSAPGSGPGTTFRAGPLSGGSLVLSSIPVGP